MEYQFRYEYSKEDLRVLQRVYRKAHRRIWNWVSEIFLLLIGAANLLAAAVSIGAEIGAFWLGNLAIGVLCLAAALFRDRLNAWSSRRLMLKGMGEIRMTLDDEGVKEKTEKGESTHPYSIFLGAYYCRERYFLFLDKRHAFILPLPALTQGDLAALGPWLEEKLGKEIQEIR